MDDAIVDLGMKHFGLNELKEKGSLVDVRVGDALENIKTKKSDADDTVKFDLIIVDLFDDQSRVVGSRTMGEHIEALEKSSVFFFFFFERKREPSYLQLIHR